MEISGTNKKEAHVMSRDEHSRQKQQQQNALVSSLTLFKTQNREQYYGNTVKQGLSIM